MNTHVRVRDKVIGAGNPPYIIAEMACAHDGDLEKAKKLIDAAVESKADAVQLQFFEADETVTPRHPVYPLLKKIEFNASRWTELFRYARSKDIHVFICTYDVPSVRLAVSLGADGIKLNSADLSNPEMMSAVSGSGIPFTLGAGASTLEEISSGLQKAGESGALNIVLMYGVQNFPTKVEDLNIKRIALLRETFGLPIGYQDHTDADDPFSKMVDLIAIGLGADLIEKHITFNRAEKGIDHQAALNPDEFKLFVEHVRRSYVAMGSSEMKSFSESDLRYRKFQKKSIVAAFNIMEGDIITRESVRFLRNENPGIAPAEISLLLGKRTKRRLAAFENILLDDVA